MPAVVSVLSVELHFPSARSLKDKRMALRSLKDRLKKFNVSVAEVDHQNLWQRTQLGIAAIGGDQQIVDRLLAEVSEEIDRSAEGLVTWTQVDHLA